MENIKEVVRKKYDTYALERKSVSCCGSGEGLMADDYKGIEGYHSDADLNLGCGLPTQFARIKKGDTVVDLGSGAGNDCFIARSETGPSGKVIGIDFSEKMVTKAEVNCIKLGFENVEFKLGDIENLPLEDELADVVVSNCVLNLVPDKKQVFSEIYRILKPGGHFSISDVISVGKLPEAIRNDYELFVGCVAGATDLDEYLEYVSDSGFRAMTIQKEKIIEIPQDLLRSKISSKAYSEYQRSGACIKSITLYAEK